MPSWAWYLVVAAVAGVSLLLLDRLLCRLELRGWIYYRLSPRQRHSLGAAAFQVEALLQPEKRHVYELKQQAEIYCEADDEGGDPPPRSS
jgi:hypothetical protein